MEACSSVDRASDSDSERQGFDSLHAYFIIGAVLVSTFKKKLGYESGRSLYSS